MLAVSLAAPTRQCIAPQLDNALLVITGEDAGRDGELQSACFRPED